MVRCILILILIVAAGSQAQDADTGTAFFEKKIRPVLVQHCYKCHAADAKNVRGGLLLDTRAGIRKGGDSGPAVVPKKLDESLLIESIRYDGYEMPPSGKLPDSVIADFEKWIELGAPDPRDGESHAVASEGIDIEEGRKFWAFQPPQQYPAPEVMNADWPASDIDRFILARIEANELMPASDADKRTLLRRVYFDLIGLPPSPAAIDAFLLDESDHALESVVDELLSSRHFGERWGRHWLDVARYSDSTGGGRSLLFKVAWRYRNYVIEAFNRGTPFDEFIVEQIAGDLMPFKSKEERSRHLTATGFLALGPTNYENQDKRQLRMDVVDEQIDTIGRAFLGMTIGCARCHDHKFDPIPTTDYYALAGIFRSTRSLIDGNVSNWITRSLPTSDGGDTDADGAIKALTSDLKKQRKRLKQLQKRAPSTTIDDDKAKLVGNWTDSTYVKSFVGRRYIHTQDPQASATYSFKVENTGSHEVLASYTEGTNRDAATPATVARNGTELRTVRIDQRKKPVDQFVSLGEYDFELGDRVTVTVHTTGARAVVIADAARLVFVGDKNSAALRTKIAGATKEIASLEGNLKSLQKAAAASSRVMSIEEEKQPADFHVCIRGNVRNLGEKVPRGFLTVASSSAVEIPKAASGRLEFAKWIASNDNPLTARVAVNRIWYQLFGSGLVRTVDNFGAPGERPSHPNLLDHLAIRFTRNGWSVKKLIRAIVLSRTYRQSSVSGSATDADPENRFFARQNLRRLEAEVLRDSLFSLSGELDLKAAEDTVRKGTKSEYGYEFTSRSRSVYLPVFRNRLHPMFAVFDFPDPNLANGRRNVSTLSTQALYLMNSPLVLQHARKTAERLLADKEADDDARLRLLYESAIGREPTQAEIRHATSFLTKTDGTDRIDQWAAICQAVIGSVDFRYVR